MIRKKPGRPVNSEMRADKRAQILEGARRCFIRDGFHKATTANISKEAGVNVASIYQYFENKDAVIESIVEQIVNQEITYLNAFDPAKLDYDSLNSFAATLYKSDEGKDGAILRAEILSEASRNPKVSEYVVNGSARIIKAITAFVERYQRQGDIPADLDAVSAATDLAYFHEGIQLHVPLTPDHRAKLMNIHVAFLAARLCIRRNPAS